jgi:hypothetical protein
MASGTDDIKDSRGLAFADFDNDGDLDIVVNNNPGDCGLTSVAPTMLKNNIGQSRRWLMVHLVGTRSNRDALGAEVRVYSKDFQALRHVHAGAGYASQSDPRLYFGLGDCQSVERMSVKWPSGAVQEFENVASDQMLMLEEGKPLAVVPYAATQTLIGHRSQASD